MKNISDIQQASKNRLHYLHVDRKKVNENIRFVIHILLRTSKPLQYIVQYKKQKTNVEKREYEEKKKV